MILQDKLSQFKTTALLDAQNKRSLELSEYKNSLSLQLASEKEDCHKKLEQRYQEKLELLKHQNNREIHQCIADHRQAISLHQIQQEHLLLKDAKTQIMNFKSTDAYLELLKLKITSVITLADSDYCKIYIDRSDSSLLPLLVQQFPVKVLLSRHSILGGIYAKIPAKNLYVDETFRTRLNQVKDTHLVQTLIHSYQERSTHETAAYHYENL